ncbi:MAG TPA: FAD binding domain-containing protein [Acidimicrobiia bacterium]|nr:FAD binding domain-containing protein [Acidimicrobiia bacterium]
MKPPAFRYERPATLAEALALLADHGDDARPLAGGQSLVPMLNLRLAAPGVVVDLNALPGFDTIEHRDGTVAVGALVRQRTLELSPEAAAIGALADGLPLVGHVATRNRGTVGGSIAHADPAAELPLALLALGGSVVAEGPSGRREIPAGDLFAGFFTTALQPGELVVEVRFPAPRPGEASALVEVAQRHGDFPLAAVAVWLRLGREGRPGDAGRPVVAARIAAGAVADRPLLLPDAADVLVAGASAEEAGRVAAAAVDPAGSLHAPAGYQRHLVGVLVARAVDRARARASGGAPAEPGTGGPGDPAPSGRPRGGGTVAGGDTTVNGRRVSLAGVPDRRLLSDFLRHDVGLRGTHVGCEHGVCGACTVRLDGVAVRSCLLLARQAAGSAVTTVEGLAAPDEARTLHPLQAAFGRHFALQCGFCTAGILLAAAERLDQVATGTARPPDEAEIRRLLSGHLCRCTGYEPIVAAIAEAAAAVREDPGP